MEDFFDNLKVKYPRLYSETWDMYVGPGWQPIVEAISSLIDNRGVKVDQIKEKFGQMRFYYTIDPISIDEEYVHGVVSMGLAMADRTCELCGAPGEGRNLPWIKTLCDTHYEERKAVYENRT